MTLLLLIFILIIKTRSTVIKYMTHWKLFCNFEWPPSPPHSMKEVQGPVKEAARSYIHVTDTQSVLINYRYAMSHFIYLLDYRYATAHFIIYFFDDQKMHKWLYVAYSLLVLLRGSDEVFGTSITVAMIHIAKVRSVAPHGPFHYKPLFLPIAHEWRRM